MERRRKAVEQSRTENEAFLARDFPGPVSYRVIGTTGKLDPMFSRRSLPTGVTKLGQCSPTVGIAELSHVRTVNTFKARASRLPISL
jgi:hypothetical protein